MCSVTKAVYIASLAHGQQKRTGCDEPYLYHCIRVMELLRADGQGERAQVLGAVHDIDEDTDWTMDDILAAMIDPIADAKITSIIARGLPALTKRPGQSKTEAVDMLADERVPDESVYVKMADRIDNLRDVGDHEIFNSEWRKKQVPSTERILEIARNRGLETSSLYTQLSKRVDEIKAE